MSNVSTVSNIVAESMKRLEQYLDYTLPFAIITDDLSIAFRSKKFHAAQDDDGDLLKNVILVVSDMLRNKIGRAYNHEYGIGCCKVAIMHSDRCMCCVYLDDCDTYSCYDLEKHHHDLHGPIRNIANFLQIIKGHIAGANIEKIDECTEFALSSVRALNELNEQIFSGNDSAVVDLTAVVDNIRHLLSTQLVMAGCTISVDRSIPPVNGNYTYVLRIFKNLVENSLRHSRAEHLAISLKLLYKTPKAVAILFEDNGTDISRETKEAIDNTLRSRDASSKSLGLKICKELMDSIYGNIRIVMEKPSCCYELTFKL
ncbi:MAG: HAMP domain-containing histidine kinase [Holosporales bacterium]|jgi:two-component sensor histidine kinase|nr:HAMP domain-containing histidine kinase [Holosporales bacterium]